MGDHPVRVTVLLLCFVATAAAQAPCADPLKASMAETRAVVAEVKAETKTVRQEVVEKKLAVVEKLTGRRSLQAVDVTVDIRLLVAERDALRAKIAKNNRGFPCRILSIGCVR